MVSGEVVEVLWADRIVEALHGRRLLHVRDGGGRLLVAVDLVDAGVGTSVLVATDEAAAAAAGCATVDAAVVALLADASEGADSIKA